MFVKDLFESIMLVEDYGNLKWVDKGFLSLLRSENTKNQKMSLFSMLGKNSELVDVPFQKSTFKDLLEDRDSISAILYEKESGKQLLMMTMYYHTKFSLSYNSYKIAVNVQALYKNDGGLSFDELRTHFVTKLKLWDKVNGNDIVASTVEKDSAKIQRIVSEVAKFTNSKNLAVKVIKRDAQRSKTSIERSKSKKGIIPVKMSNEEKISFEKAAKEALSKRLQDFKKIKIDAKSGGVTHENFVEILKKEGFLDAFTVNGYTYKYTNSSINFDSLRKNDQGWNKESYVAYYVDEDDPKYVEVFEKYGELRRELKAQHPVEAGQEQDPDVLRELEKIKRRLKIPPRKIEIMLKFEGGMIVPSHLRIDK